MTAYDKALQLLGMREHGRKELERKLIAKGYGREESSAALDRLAQEGWQSDERFAESFIRSRLRKNPEGQALLRARLVEKGIDSGLASLVVERYFDEHTEEVERIYAEYRKKTLERKGELKGRAALARKGLGFRD